MGAHKKLIACRLCREKKLRCDRQIPCKTCIRRNRAADCQPTPRSLATPDKVAIPRTTDSAVAAPLSSSLSNAAPTPRFDVDRPDEEDRVLWGAPSSYQAPHGYEILDLSRAHELHSDEVSTQRPRDTYFAQGRRKDHETDQSVPPSMDPHTHTEAPQTSHELPLLTVAALHIYNDAKTLSGGQRSPPAPPTSSLFGVRRSDSERTQWCLYLANSLPPRPQCDLFVSYFFENINWIYQAIHAPSFYEKYHAFWAGQVQDIDFIWLALLYIVMCLSALYLEPAACDSVGFDGSKVRDGAHRWFRLSRMSLQAGEFEARPCLTQIQVFLESQLYWYATKSVEILNAALGQTIRCAQAIGLDKDRAPSTNLATEMRHRIWWDLCSSDVYQSLCLDRFPLIQAHLSEVPMPRNCHDPDMTATSILGRPIHEPTCLSVHVFRARLFKALSKLYADHGVHLTSYDAVSAVDAEVTAIMDEPPWYLRRREGGDDAIFVSSTLPLAYDYLAWQHHVLHNSISVQRIRMYRPFLRTRHHASVWSKYVAAVEGAFAVYHSIRAWNPVRFRQSQKLLVQSYQSFCSALSVAVFLLVERPLLSDRIQTEIELVIQDLKSLTEDHHSIPMAVDGRATLVTILDACRQLGYPSRHYYVEEDHGEDAAAGPVASTERATTTTTITAATTTSGPHGLHALVPEIYSIMGGPSKSQKYLDRCAVSHLVSQDVATQGSMDIVTEPSPMSSRAHVAASPPPFFTSAPTAGASGGGPMPLGEGVSISDAADTALNLNLNLLHFDVLNWDVEDFAFLDAATNLDPTESDPVHESGDMHAVVAA